jgi:hypothetical protein
VKGSQGCRTALRLVAMAVEIGLADGTKLVLTDPNTGEDDVLRKLSAVTPAGSAGVVSFDTEKGTYRINPAYVVYVRQAAPKSGRAEFV